MALLDYPIPELDTTLKEASRVLQLILSPEDFVQYRNILSQQRGTLQEAQRKLKASVSCNENWVTDNFKARLLSCCDPLPTSTAIPSVLPPSRAKGESAQLERASTLLWAAAKLYSEPWLIEGEAPTERTQQSEVFASSRLPGKSQDQIKVILFQKRLLCLIHGVKYLCYCVQNLYLCHILCNSIILWNVTIQLVV